MQPTLVVDLADPRLIGRYMALSALSWQVGFMLGPAVGGVLLARRRPGLWLVMALGLLVAGAAALPLERALPEAPAAGAARDRAHEPVPLPVAVAEQETARMAG